MADDSFIVTLLLAIVLQMVALICSNVIHRNNVLWIQPSGAAMIVGMVFGAIVHAAQPSLDASFDGQFFYYGLLPPIVYAAGFTLRRAPFFHNFGSIMLFAFAGTIIACFVFGGLVYAMWTTGFVQAGSLGDNPFLNAMIFGALISATDPVGTLAVFADMGAEPLVYNLVFGESVLNDAVAVVLFTTLRRFAGVALTAVAVGQVAASFVLITVGSIGIGVGAAVATSLVLKRLGLATDSPGVMRAPSFKASNYAIVVLLLSAFSAFLAAEAAAMSGIMSIFFCGILHSRYAVKNLSPAAAAAAGHFFEALAFLCETFVFAYVGLQVAGQAHAIDVGLVATAVPLCILARAAGTFPLAALANTWRAEPLTWRVQLLMWVCGLRGAIAYSLSINLSDAEGRPAVSVATFVVVIVTTLGFGAITGPLLSALGLRAAGPPPHGDALPPLEPADSDDDVAADVATRAESGGHASLSRPSVALRVWAALASADRAYVVPLLTRGRRARDSSPRFPDSSPRFPDSSPRLPDASPRMADSSPRMTDSDRRDAGGLDSGRAASPSQVEFVTRGGSGGQERDSDGPARPSTVRAVPGFFAAGPGEEGGENDRLLPGGGGGRGSGRLPHGRLGGD